MTLSFDSIVPIPVPIFLKSDPGRRYAIKFSQNLASGQPIPWNLSRCVTPASFVIVQGETFVKLVNFVQSEYARLFYASNDVQGLLSGSGVAQAASVSTKVPTPAGKRCRAYIHYHCEGSDDLKPGDFAIYTHYISNPLKLPSFAICISDQFYMDHYNPTWADYRVDATNYPKKPQDATIFYSGCHLIDHQFAAENSDKEPLNFYPGHFYLNTPIKNYLVQRCDSYIEMPIYTPNPPCIKNNKKGFHPIPVAVLFLLIKDQQISEIYCFPNNQFNYHYLIFRKNLLSESTANIVPHFKLKKAFHRVLAPAVIHYLKAGNQVPPEQLAQEKTSRAFFKCLARSILGRNAQSDGDFFRLAHQVMKKKSVKVMMLLDSSSPENEQLLGRDPAFRQAYTYLAQFIVTTGLSNCMKTEIVQIKSRLVFVEMILQLIEKEHELPGKGFLFLNSFYQQIANVLNELYALKDDMTLDELFALTDTYANLTYEGFYPFCKEEHMIYGSDDFHENYQLFIQLLTRLKSHESCFSQDQIWRFLLFIQDADNTRKCLDHHDLIEEFEEEAKLLFNWRPFYADLLARLPAKPSHAYNKTLYSNVGALAP